MVKLSIQIESASGTVLFKYLKKETALDVLERIRSEAFFLEATNPK